jgi:hypothetical protein
MFKVRVLLESSTNIMLRLASVKDNLIWNISRDMELPSLCASSRGILVSAQCFVSCRLSVSYVMILAEEKESRGTVCLGGRHICFVYELRAQASRDYEGVYSEQILY